MNSIGLDEESQLATLARFLRSATDRQTTPEDALAEAFGKTFYPADIKVRWLHSAREGVTSEEGKWLAPRRGWLREIPVQDIPQMQTWTEGNPLEGYRFARASSADLEGIRIVKSPDDERNRQELEVIFRRVAQPLPVNRIENFRRNTTNSTILFQAFTSLKAAGLQWRQPAADWTIRLDQTVKDLQLFQTFPGRRDLRERLLEELLADLFSEGRDVDEIVSFGRIAQIAKIASSQYASPNEASSDYYRGLVKVLAASVNEGDAGVNELGPLSDIHTSSHFALVAAWTRLHARARKLLRRASRKEERTAFGAEFLQQARTLTPRLHDVLHSASWDAGIETTCVSSWLRLWFCLSLLMEAGSADGRAVEVERLSYYCDLSYVVRESLRALQAQPTARFHLPSLSAALVVLVEHHAKECLKLPHELNLGGILTDIGQVGQESAGGFASGHLHHVLEMYIGGMFLLDTRLAHTEGLGGEGSWEGATVCQALASAGGTLPGTHRQLELRQSFGLGALLHDLGVLLFPHWPRRAVELGGREGGLHGRLLEVRGTLTESVQHLLSICRAELLADEVFNDAVEPAISEWIMKCGAAGEADHSVLGAWHFVHHGRQIVSRAVLKKTARSILFHAIPAQEIRADEEPAAALLVLCDEIFAWHQGRDLPQRRPLPHKGEPAGFEPRCRDSIFRRIRLPGLHLELDENTQRLVPILDLTKNLAAGDAAIWPRIELDLKEQEALPLQVYEYWLLLSQNLRRLQKSNSGWGPNISIRSQAAAESSVLGTRELLARSGLKTSMELRPYLRRWLELHADPGGDEGFEAVLIGPSAERLGAKGRIETYFPELENLVASVLREVDLRLRDTP
jgi:hypothetical protein